MKKIDIDVKSVCCLQCATTIEKEVARLKGVKEAVTDWDKKKLTVKYSEAEIEKPAIMAKFREVLKRFEGM
jgi:copper chaperone CopZ